MGSPAAIPINRDLPRACTRKLELGQCQPADVGFRANTGRKSAHLGTSAFSQYRKFASSPLPLKSNRILAHRDAGGGSPSTASRTDFALEPFKAKDVY